MTSSFSKQDRRFLLSLLGALILYGVVLFAYPALLDEGFYASIPLRLICGDRMMVEEWHLTQFSALFTYLPVKLWLSLMGSSQGLILFLRCVYLLIHTALAVTVYKVFRSCGPWSIPAALLFYTQTPYRLLAISYNSFNVLFLLLLTLCLCRLWEEASPKNWILAGLCVGGCCICNPLTIPVLPVYPVLWVLRRLRKTSRSNSSLGDRIFSREAALFGFGGICLMGLFTVAFFLLQGGSFSFLVQNLSFILQASEYGIFSLGDKLRLTWEAYLHCSLGLPLLLPALFAAMILDKKRYAPGHRLVYLSLSLLLALLHMAGILLTNLFPYSFSFAANPFTLPFLIFSGTCYVLTERKNKKLFVCMWLPGLLGAVIQYIPSNTLLTALGFALGVNLIPGVLFIRDLFRELPSPKTVCRGLLCTGLCLQLAFQGLVCLFGQLPAADSSTLTQGPYAGLLADSATYQSYTNTVQDLTAIEQRSRGDEPVLILSSHSWMYLCTDLPIGTYTTWFESGVQEKVLTAYYTLNPHKIPKYIYFDAYNLEHCQHYLTELEKLFHFTAEELTEGLLLTVHGCKFP